MNLNPAEIRTIIKILEDKRRQYAPEYAIYQITQDPGLRNDALRYVKIDRLINKLKGKTL